MTTFEMVSIVGLFVGPLLAVAITLWNQRETRLHERRLDIARKLLDTHHDAGERDYSTAIRLIPVEFRHDRRVLDAWRAIMENVAYSPTAENQPAHNAQFLDRKFGLIHEVCRSAGITLSEAEIRTSTYEARAYSDAKQLDRDAKNALVQIAENLNPKPARAPGKPQK